MALIFFIVGAAIIVAAIRNTQGDLGTLVAGDFSGPNSFLYWLAVGAILGLVGYVPAFRNPSRVFMGLLIVVLLLTKGTGFFSQLQSALAGAKPQTTQPPGPATPTTGVPIDLGGSNKGGVGGAVSSAAGAVGTIGKIFGGFL